MVAIRRAVVDDLPLLPGIERAAGEAFRVLGMDTVAGDEPPTVEELGVQQQDGRIFVAVDDDRVVAYLVVELIADAAHIEQVTVHPDAAGRRIGSQLIDAARRWAHEHGLTSLTLTSYRDVPWNAPYYARLGFTVVPEIEQPPALQAVRRAEAARGLDAWPRVAMQRRVAWP